MEALLDCYMHQFYTQPAGCRPLIALIATVGIVAAPLVVSPTMVKAVHPGYNGKIAIQTDRDGNNEIYVMNADGSNPVNITNNLFGNGTPIFSPDGSRIVFQTDRDGNNEIYVMNADGSDQTRISDNLANDIEPTWSPDGTHIAFASNRDGNYEIYVVDVNGTVESRLTTDTSNDRHPSWSPDGSKIVFYSNRGGSHQIYVMNPDGSGLANLSGNAHNESYPTWSPDGSHIVFSSNRDGNDEIYVMDTDGTNQTRLTTDSAVDYSPSFSPDGEHIVFTSFRSGGIREIFVMNLDGSNQTQLTVNSSYDDHADWQPIPNTAPNTASDTATSPSNSTTTIDVLANDTDEETLDGTNLTISVEPLNGTASIESGQVTYTPDDGFTGSDQLTYQICDSFMLDQKCATGVLGITVQAPGAPAVSLTTIGTATFSNGTTSYTSNSSRPTFSGTATPGTEIKVEINSDPIILTATTNGAGEWSVTPDQDIPYGEHNVSITATKDGVSTTLDTFVLSITTGALGTETPNTGASTTAWRFWGMTLLAAGSGLYLTRRRLAHRTVGTLPPLFPNR